MKKFLLVLLSLSVLLSLVSCAAMEEAGDFPGAIGGVMDGMLEEDALAPSEGVSDETNGTLPAAGQLTAGEWKDLDELDFWRTLLRRNDWYALMEARNLFADKLAAVLVLDREEQPLFNTSVELLAEDGTRLYAAKTDVSGMAYLPYDLNRRGAEPKTVRVGGDTVTELAAEGVTTVVLDADKADVTALDLMFTVDTTGSMGDELRYLQAELNDVIARVSEQFDNSLSIRISVNFYRDEGDEYVVRPFAFTEDISLAVEQMGAQRSDGGGDYPEAVHTALESSVYEHLWREDAVKLMFLVLDAPPHSDEVIKGINAQLQTTVTKAAEEGIRIIPVASSGVDTETEFLLRSYAVMTGGTYLFLTNHSGIGNDHLEPTVGQYEVEQFNDCLVRVIGEYCEK